MQFYYHTDHLGSSSYITNLDGEVAQHIEYVPFGEVFIEERNNTWNTPYLFNAKEFDEETGLYYYGARYMNPITSLWYGVDPLAEKYVTIGGFVYTLANPVKLIDPDGNKVIPKLYVNNGSLPVSYYRSPRKFRKAMRAFAKTTYGRKVLADFTEVGKTIFGVKGNGKYADYNLVLDEESFDGANSSQIRTAEFLNSDGSWIIAQTQMNKDSNGKPEFTIIFDLSYSSEELAETITHEFSVHLYKYSKVLNAFRKHGSYKAANNLWECVSGKKEHHDLIQRHPNLKGTKLYRMSRIELINQNNKLKSTFDHAIKEYTENY